MTPILATAPPVLPVLVLASLWALRATVSNTPAENASLPALVLGGLFVWAVTSAMCFVVAYGVLWAFWALGLAFAAAL